VNVHLIAIGGAVMHNLALDLKALGHQVSGSDDQIFEPSKSRLADAGLLPTAWGWFPDKIHAGLDVVILGMHARADNLELLKAQALGLRIMSFPEFVYDQSKEKKRLVVAGSHGKTTITAMIMHVLKFHKMDFDYLVGSQLEGFNRMVRITKDAPVIVLEGDEYLASPLDPRPKFLHYHAHAAVISGIAWDHINVFPTYASYVAQFEALMDTLEDGAVLGYFDGDADLVEIAEKRSDRLKLKPYHAVDHVIEEGYTFLKTSLGLIPIQVFGKHNIANIAAARILTEEAGVSKVDFYTAIASFKGTARRLESWPSKVNYRVYRDFAHAPSKVAATVEAVRTQHADEKLVACLELHTFSSLTKSFLPNYAGSMDSPDIAIIYYNPDTIAQKKLPALAEAEVKAAFQNDKLEVFTDSQKLLERLSHLAGDPACFLLMSSGNYDNLDLKKLFE
jgi:UDP-N-acetylmuramate: L-alanyl-gamma-D-glutamyl-meso-diaminopimelate ligase